MAAKLSQKVVQKVAQKGFSLIELVVGIVLFSIAMMIVVTLVINQTKQSIDPVLQSRAAALAKSLADEIVGRAFDENSNLDGALLRCDEDESVSCSATLGPEESRSEYDDVDDYDNLFSNSGGSIQNALGLTIQDGTTDLYEGFAVDVQVEYDSRFGSEGKQIIISVTTPGNDVLDFAFYRMNF